MFDIAHGAVALDGTTRTIAWAYFQNYGVMLDVPDHTDWLYYLEVIAVLIAFLMYVWPDILRAIQRLLSSFVDLTTFRRSRPPLSPLIRLIILLSDSAENCQRTYAWPSGSGKSTSAALFSVDRIPEVGGALADKDRMTSSRVIPEDQSDLPASRDDVIESMRLSDESESEPSIMEYIIACLIGNPSRTEFGNLARRAGFWRTRALEVLEVGRRAGFRDIGSVNCVHSPFDVKRSYGFIPIQSWDGVISVPTAHSKWVLEQRIRPRDSGGWGADIDTMKRRMEMDVEACRGYEQIDIQAVQNCNFVIGVPMNAGLYLTIPSLTGDEPYLVPQSLKSCCKQTGFHLRR